MTLCVNTFGSLARDMRWWFRELFDTTLSDLVLALQYHYRITIDHMSLLVMSHIFGCIIQLLVAHARYTYSGFYSTTTLCVLGWFTLRNVSETCVQLNSGILGCLYEARGTNHIIDTYIMVLFLLYIFICIHRMTWRGQNIWANYWVARKSRTRSVK